MLLILPLYAGTLTIDALLIKKGILLQTQSTSAIDFNRDRSVQKTEIVPDANGDGKVVTKEILDFAVVNASDQRLLRDILSVFSEPAEAFLYPEVYRSAASHYRLVIASKMRELSLKVFKEEYALYLQHDARHVELSLKRESMIKETFDAAVIKALDADIAREGLLREQSGGRLSLMGAHPLMKTNQFYLPDGDLVRVADRKTDVLLHDNGSIRSITLYRPLARSIKLNKVEQKVSLEKTLELYANGMWSSFSTKESLTLTLRGKAVKDIRSVYLSPQGSVEGYALDAEAPHFFEKRSPVAVKMKIEGERSLVIPVGTPRAAVGRSIRFDTIGELFVAEMRKLGDSSWYIIDAEKSSSAKVTFLSGRIEAPAKSVYALRFEKNILSEAVFRDAGRPQYSSNIISRMTNAPQLFSESTARVTKIVIGDTISIMLDEALFTIEEDVLVVPRYEIQLSRSGAYLNIPR